MTVHVSFENVVAGATALTLATILGTRLTGKTIPTGIFTHFITPDDIAAGRAEEEAEKHKLELQSGKSTVKPSDPSLPVDDATVPSATESTPLLGSASSASTIASKIKHNWRSISLTILGALELIGRTGVLGHTIVQTAQKDVRPFALFSPIIFFLAWFHAATSPFARPFITVPYDLLLIHLLSLASAFNTFYIVGVAYGGPDSESPFGQVELLLQVLNAIITIVGLTIIGSTKMVDNGEPKVDAEGLQPAGDDFVTLFQWLSFNWMSGFVDIGSTRAVEEIDIWQLSQLLRARIVMAKFRTFQKKTLMRRLFFANALDILLDCVLSIVSAILTVIQPFLFNWILKALESQESISQYDFPLSSVAFSLPPAFYTIPSSMFMHTLALAGIQPTSSLFTASLSPSGDYRQLAYFYAVITFLAQVTKSQTDLQHLYYSRRASIRAQAELIGSIYEKSLVRKDITGAVASDAAAALKSKKAIAAAGPEGSKDADKAKKEAEKEKDKAVQSADVGKIVSLIATDSTQVSTVAVFLTRLYEIPIYLVGSAYLLYSLMGWTAFVGYAAFIVALPGNWYLMSEMWKLRKTLLDVRDKRMREMNQVIQAIKFIKFFAWESKWEDRVMDARKREMKWLRKSKWLGFLMSFFWDVIPLGVSVVSFASFVLITKGDLTVAIAFPALTAFGMLTQALTMFPMIASWLIQTYTSLIRIDKYLQEDEVPEWVTWHSESRLGTASTTAVGTTDSFDDHVGFVKASFAWTSPNKQEEKKADKPTLRERVKNVFKRKDNKAVDTEAPAADETAEEDKPFELRDLDVFFKQGKINLVSGPTGCGKSSLLSALLGEMACTSGTVLLPKSPLRVDPATGLRNDVSYCAQQPWLQHQSIRDNILFGLAYDEKRYNDVLKACQLTVDLDLLEDGDQTEIGEKGVSLSGGQKARVALARAIYPRSKTVILDDVLSAVDSHTAERLINECLCGPLMKDRTIILVTHHVDLIISRASYVIQLEEGTIVAQGTPEELRSKGLLTALKEKAAKEVEAVAPVAEDTPDADKPAEGAEGATETKKPARKLVDKEDKAEGRVSAKIYHVYLKASSYMLFGIAIVLILFHYIADMSQKFWMRFWGESYDSVGRLPFDFPNPSDNVWPYLLGYIALQVITAFITIASQVPSLLSSLRASRVLYKSMLHNVVRAPSRWFDKTPSGRILNRFSKDIDTVDSGLQFYFNNVLETMIASIVTVATILWGTPFFIVPLVIILVLQVWISRGYVGVSRDLRRIESNTRSPIIASFSELINGIATVRAFGTERHFINNVYERLDRVQAANYYYWMCNRWLLFRLDTMGAFIVLFATLIAIASGVSPGLAGIVISSSSGLIMNLYWLLRFYTEMEQSMNSVERINDYMDVPSEPPAIIEDSRPPAYWPSSDGSVAVENLVLKYAPELDPVLKNISFEIRPREKIGLVGRTGSGKSTLALAFFRFVDPDQGKIIIDGIDITKIGLGDLRGRLTIIPQDAVLFSGTIRDNLDPFNEHSDEDCLDALRRVQLRTAASPGSTAVASRASSRPVSPLPTDESPTESLEESSGSTIAANERGKTIITLDTQVSESGNNFSAGQRQLIAMARALLRRSRFVVMDESTASVDFATDLKIQEAIREEFKDSILVTIAHRLRTVIDYDRILVLDAGEIAEFDTPKNLIAKEDGIFRGMCLKTGDFDELKEAAERRADW